MLHVRTDRELAELLEMSAPQISKIRTGIHPVMAQLLANLLDATDVKLRELPERVAQTPVVWVLRVRAGAKNKNPTAL